MIDRATSHLCSHLAIGMTTGQNLRNDLGSAPSTVSLPATSVDSTSARFLAFGLGETQGYEVSPSSSVDELCVPGENVDRGSPWLRYTITITGIHGKERVRGQLFQADVCTGAYPFVEKALWDGRGARSCVHHTIRKSCNASCV